MKPSSTRPLLVQPVEDRVVPERRPALVHHLGLRLRIEILRELAHDAHELALPRLELRRVLLDEIEDVLLRLGRETPSFGAVARSAPRSGSVRHRSLNCRSRCASRSASRAVSRLERQRPRAADSDRRRAPSAHGRRRALPRPPPRRGAPRTPSRSGARTRGSRGWRRPRSTAGTGDCP